MLMRWLIFTASATRWLAKFAVLRLRRRLRATFSTSLPSPSSPQAPLRLPECKREPSVMLRHPRRVAKRPPVVPFRFAHAWRRSGSHS
jgi:hypothetical protein